MKRKPAEKENKLNQITPAALHPDHAETVADYKLYNNNIELLTEEYITANYTNKCIEELKQDKAFFPLLVNYLYKNYIGDLLKNKPAYKANKIKPYYNIHILDQLFDIYIELVYKYKFNNRPLIVEFSLFTGINRDIFYDWLKGLNNNYIAENSGGAATGDIIDTVAKWISTCERALIDGQDTIKDLFILKSKYGYREASNDIQITVNHKTVIDADNLPELIGINSKN